MTYAARKVLADCRIALQLLEEETELSRWRVLWAGALALVRAVGHVLEKVYGENPVLRKAARDAYKSWKDPNTPHEIFREFIERERNSILKEYIFRIHPLQNVGVIVDTILKRQLTGQMRRSTGTISIDENIYRPILDGFREGHDARDVLTDALIWWESELDAVDVLVAGRHHSKDSN